MTFMTKTPLRISFFGGGSDYLEYLEYENGAILGGSINKFVYIYQLPMSEISLHKYKVSYRQIEEVNSIDLISHPVVREGLRLLEWNEPINITTMSDIPGGTGLGSSSAFSVGFIHLITRIQGLSLPKINIMKLAHNLEYKILNENVGIQDHLHAVFGGLSMYELSKGKVKINPLNLDLDFLNTLNNSLILVYTNIKRHASGILDEQIEFSKNKTNHNEIKNIVELTYIAEKKLTNPKTSSAKKIKILGELLQESWQMKKYFSSKISSDKIDNMIKIGLDLGAYGAKLCGAGGGGFICFVCDDKSKKSIIHEFGDNNCIDIEFISSGSEFKTL